jgi:hypothetical protein
MYTRLWWKDARQFWPIWAFLFLAAGVTQLFVHHYASPENREVVLGLLAVGWAGLYAFAVGAAAFAGERETGTLRLLDVLPAPRRVVWAGKVSFALITTIALAALLLGLAMLDAPIVPLRRPGASEAALLLGSMLLMGLAVSLFCSAVLNSALLAAVTAIGLTTIGHLVMLDQYPDRSTLPLPARELALALVALVGSLVAFSWGRRSRRLPIALQLRSPIEVRWTGRPRAGASPSRAATEPAVTPSAPAPTPAMPIPGRSIAAPAIWTSDRPRPRLRLAELRSLAWQTMRQGRTTWLLLLAIGLIGPAQLLLDAVTPDALIRTPLPLIWNAMIALVAGVSVFGLENRRRTQRLLVHHGARPGLVWTAKLATWCFGLMIIWAPLAFLVVSQPANPRAIENWTKLVLGLSLGFAVAVLCGMALPRLITAAVVAMVISLTLALAQFGLAELGMLPAWGLIVLPVVLLAVSWAWSGDWLLERPAPGRWVRLGLILSGALTTTFAGYAGWRAWSVPDVGPIPMPAAWAATSAPLPPDRDAAPIYREATDQLYSEAASAVHDPNLLDRVARAPDMFPRSFDLIRRAAMRPDCRWFGPERITLARGLDLPPLRLLGDLVAARARGRLGRGDLVGAWDDITTIFRMARHLGRSAMLGPGLHALAIERQALGLAGQWAEAPGQSPDRLRAAIAAYRDLPPMPPAPDVMRGEGLAAERTIDLPIDDLRDWLVDYSRQGQPERAISVEELLRLDLATTPWERARARRVNRLLTAELARLASLEPRQRPADRGQALQALGPSRWLPGLAERSWVAEVLSPNTGSYLLSDDLNEVGHRALVQVLAIRAWQLRHGGRFPERLEDLVPEELPGLPLDPYSGRPFGIIPRAAEIPGPPPSDPSAARPTEIHAIYSVGLDGRAEPASTSSDDIVFPIRPLKSAEKRP